MSSPYPTELGGFEDAYDAMVGHYTLQPKGLPEERRADLMQVCTLQVCTLWRSLSWVHSCVTILPLRRDTRTKASL
jgi:hypothetical protein